MALFHTTVLDNQIKALPTVGTASGSIATFDTDMTENLVEVKCQIVAQQSGSGTPSPSNPRPITTYTSLNLSHSGADTSNPTVYNIPFGQTVANGVLDITTGKLRVTHGVVLDMSQLSWVVGGSSRTRYDTTDLSSLLPDFDVFVVADITCEVYPTNSAANLTNKQICALNQGGTNFVRVLNSDYVNDTAGFTSSLSGKKLVYELATPIEIQLDSITLQALLNENNVWCDTGDTSVKFLLTVGKKIS